MINIAILAVNDCMESCISGARDIFTVASSVWKKRQAHSTEELFLTAVITFDNTPVYSFNGIEIQPTHDRHALAKIDLLFIPVINGDLNLLLKQNELIDWIASLHKTGTIICAVCAGAFLLAQTGILDGKSATTHWSLAHEFDRLFPDVSLKQEHMIVDEGDCITAGGVTAYLDLALYISGRFGSQELISELSKLLLIDPARRLQTPYKAFSTHIEHTDSEVLLAQQWLLNHSDEAITLRQLAQVAGLEPRTFSRRFKQATGDTPMGYLRQLRIKKARTLLETTAMSFDDITFTVGYEDVSSFRRLFTQTTGLSPSVYRKRFTIFYS